MNQPADASRLALYTIPRSSRKEQPRSLANAIVLTASLTSAPLKWLRSGANNGLQTHRLGHTQNYWHPPLTDCRIAKLTTSSCRTAPTTHPRLHLTIPRLRRAFRTVRFAAFSSRRGCDTARAALQNVRPCNSPTRLYRPRHAAQEAWDDL